MQEADVRADAVPASPRQRGKPAIHLWASKALALVSKVCGVIALIGMAALVILFVASIASRLLNMSIPSVDDLGSILLGAVFAFGLGAAVGARQHLAIDLAVNRLPAGVKLWVSRATALATIAVAGYLMVGLFRLTETAFLTNQKMLGALPIPRYVPMGTILLGEALFFIALLLQFASDLSDR